MVYDVANSFAFSLSIGARHIKSIKKFPLVSLTASYLNFPLSKPHLPYHSNEPDLSTDVQAVFSSLSTYSESCHDKLFLKFVTYEIAVPKGIPSTFTVHLSVIFKTEFSL